MGEPARATRDQEARAVEPPEAAPVEVAGPSVALVRRLAAQGADAQPSSPRSLLRLQRTAGNSATTGLLARDRFLAPAVDRAIQRVAVPVEYSELLQQGNAGTSFTPTTYSIGQGRASRSAAGETRPSRYQLTRSPTGVGVEVRIKFIDPVNGRGGVGVELPAETATDQRRSHATAVCGQLVNLWNDKYRFVATEVNPVAGVVDNPRTIDLPVRFTATAVLDIDAEADAEVNMHLGQAGTGAAFDAGNYYRLASNGQPPGIETYAHEFGHLIGIPDEYNQSNAQAHAILHDAARAAGAPSSAGPAMARRLDDATRRVLVLRAMRPRLLANVGSIAGSVATAFATKQRVLSAQLASVLRSAWRDQATIDALVTTYQAALAGVPGATARMPRVMAFEARDNLSYRTVANNAVGSSVSAASLQGLVRSAFTNAIDAAIGNASRIAIAIGEDQGGAMLRTDSMDISIETIGVTGTDSALDTAATQMAGAVVSGAPAPGGMSTPLAPSPSLQDDLTGLPGSWEGVEDLFATEAANLPALIQASATTLASTPTLTSASAAALYRYLYNEIAIISADTARSTVNAFLRAQITPMLNAQVERIIGAVQAEADQHTTAAPGGGTNAAPMPPDPAIAGVAATINERVTAMMQTATAGASHVRYDVNSLMGNDHRGNLSIRSEQLDGILGEFNTRFRRPDESEFETRAAGA